MIRIKESDIVTSLKVSKMLVKAGAPIMTASHYRLGIEGYLKVDRIKEGEWDDNLYKEATEKGHIIPAWDINSLLAPTIYKGSVLMKGRKIFEVQLWDKETNELFYGCAHTMADALGICVANSLKANNNGEDTPNSRP